MGVGNILYREKLIIKDINKIIQKRGLETAGKVQRFIDSEVMRVTDPYVPFDSGTLKSSAIRHTKVGSGNVRYRTPYARRMYYGTHFNFQGAPMRGAKWFDRMKANHKRDILRGAIKIAGGKK